MKSYLVALLVACTVPMVAHAQTADTITVAKADTLTPKFTITTDTVLKVVGTRIVAAHCGVGHIFYRTWKGTTTLHTHTELVNVPCPGQPPPATSSVGICFMDPLTAQALHIRGDTTIDPSKLPLNSCTNAPGSLTLPGTRIGSRLTPAPFVGPDSP